MKDLLGLADLSPAQLSEVLSLAAEFLSSDGRPQTPERYRNALAGRSVALLFFEPSTRTRASFELSVARLGGYPLQFSSEMSSMRKGESELDTCRNLLAMGVDGFVIRHSAQEIPLQIAAEVDVPVFNAGNGSGEHPTQGLLDLLTIQQALGRNTLEGVRVAIIGDIAHSRVARSDTIGLRKLGASVVLAGPQELLPEHTRWDAEFATSRAEALEGADVVIMLRVQAERMPADTVDFGDYVARWRVDEDVLAREAKPDVLLMHPGPVIWGTELGRSVADSDRSLILKQVAAGVAVRQAVLLHAMELV